MSEHLLRCVPERARHEFNNNPLCQCGMMRDDGTCVRVDAVAPPLPLQESAAIVFRHVREATPLGGRELEMVYESMRATLDSVLRRG